MSKTADYVYWGSIHAPCALVLPSLERSYYDNGAVSHEISALRASLAALSQESSRADIVLLGQYGPRAVLSPYSVSRVIHRLRVLRRDRLFRIRL